MISCVLAVICFDLHHWLSFAEGGAGKSTLARLFARELAQDGFTVKIADLDTQQTTCTEWASDRAEAGIEPEIQVQPFGNLKTALAEATRFNAYILDGRPHSSQQTIEIARAAHLIVIPTGQTKDDLRPAVKLAHNLADCGIDRDRMAFALARRPAARRRSLQLRLTLNRLTTPSLRGFSQSPPPMAWHTMRERRRPKPRIGA